MTEEKGRTENVEQRGGGGGVRNTGRRKEISINRRPEGLSPPCAARRKLSFSFRSLAGAGGGFNFEPLGFLRCFPKPLIPQLSFAPSDHPRSLLPRTH